MSEMSSLNTGNEMVTVDSLSQLTGFPEEMIKSELGLSDSETSLDLQQLRDLMVRFIDSTMIR